MVRFGDLRGFKRGPGLCGALFCTALLSGFGGTMPARGQERGTGTTGSMEELRKLNESVDALLRKVSPSVVQILVTGYGQVEESERGNTGVVIGHQRAIGSGFVVDPSGYILTNAHVVNGAQRVQVVLSNVTSDDSIDSILAAKTNLVPARIIGVTREIDLALLKVELKGLPALELANYRDLRQGESVFALGSPEGLRNSVTHGIVSSVARQTDPDATMVYVQTDAPINPGNSGGPLVDVNGDVVGVNTFILSQSGGNEGLGFAIPCGVANIAYQQLKRFGHLHRSEIGISVQTITPTLAEGLKLPRKFGVIVSDVAPDGPALEAGLRVGDILVAIDGRAAGSVPYVAYHLMSREAGDKVHLDVLRESLRLGFDVPLKEAPHDMDQITALADAEKNLIPTLGILGVEIDKKIAAMAPDLRDPFGIIVAARAAGAAAEVPLTTGDVIRTFNGEPMTTLDRLRDALQALKPGAAVVLQIQRDQKLMYVAFTLD
jgi:serine protease Do